MPSTLSKLGSLTTGRSLATLRNKDGWKQWKPKARAYFSRNEIDSPLEGPEPERQTIEPTNAAANAHNAMQQAIDAGEVAGLSRNLASKPTKNSSRASRG